MPGLDRQGDRRRLLSWSWPEVTEQGKVGVPGMGVGGNGLLEVGEIRLIVESCLPGAAYWTGKEVFLAGGGRGRRERAVREWKVEGGQGRKYL